MRAPKFFIFLFFACNVNTFYSQSSKLYFSSSEEALQKIKNEALKTNDYEKAAEIKRELDYRSAEKKKADSLQTILDNVVKSTDYTKAAQIQATIKNIQKKEELRKNIASAVAKQDYEQANQYKNELNSLVFGNKSKEQAAITTNTTPSQNSDYFEGKIEYDVVYKAVMTKTRSYTQTTYYKNGNVHSISSDNNSNQIINCDNHWFMFANNNTANFINWPNSAISEIKYLEEYKIINGYNCQKIIFTTNTKGITTRYEGFATKDIKSYVSCHPVDFLLLEYTQKIKGMMEGNYTFKSISKEPVADAVFTNIPQGYAVKDNRTNQTSYTSSVNQPVNTGTSSTETIDNPTERNNNTLIVENGEIQIDNKLIGSYTEQLVSGNYSTGGTTMYKITSANGDYIAKIILITPATTSSEAIKIRIYKGSDVLGVATPFKTFEDNLDKRVDHIRYKAIKWLVNNHYL